MSSAYLAYMRSKIAAEDGGFVTAGAGADFQKHVAPVVRILRQQQSGQVRLAGNEFVFDPTDVLLRQLAHLGVVFAEQRLRVFQLGLQPLVGLVGFDDRFELGEFLRQVGELVAVGHDFRVREQVRHLFEAIGEARACPS